MSMNNDSVTNEKMIKDIQRNIKHCCNRKPIHVLYWSIINLSVLPKITQYEKRVEQFTPEAINHHGCKFPVLKFSFEQKQADQNISIALKILRKILPYNSACFCLRTLEQSPDTLYHVINDFKYRINNYVY